jgi:glutamyl/glutaminyl-tRNA synthetase
MPTVAGLRRRGVTPAAIRHFCHRIGVTNIMAYLTWHFSNTAFVKI